MIDKRQKNAEIFRDTQKMYDTEPALVEAVSKGIKRQKFIGEKDDVAWENDTVTQPDTKERANVVVSSKRSLEAAESYARLGKKVCVLNFASATNPGGGVTRGSSAQEECICRCTTLYPCLNSDKMWELFYKPHRSEKNPLYNNDCIYTPDVWVFKNDVDFPTLMPVEMWWQVNILTCAAPNLREKPSNEMNPCAGDQAAKLLDSELETLLTSRIRRIFEIATAEGNRVLVLGAFGCGAFMNPPAVVAKVFYNVMQDFIGCFETIEYAVYHLPRETENYETFRRQMGSATKGAGKTEKKIIYSEPAEYFPREIRKKYKLGEFNDSFSQR